MEDYYSQFNQRYKKVKQGDDFEPEEQANVPSQVKEGCYEVHRKVLYMVDLFDEFTDPYVLVFPAQDAYDIKNPVKAWKWVNVQDRTEYKPTVLGQIARKELGPQVKTKRVQVYADPLFMSPVVEGKDTFTHAEGLGFNERTPDKVTAEGEPSGVFISLRSIHWLRTYIPKRSLIAYYHKRKSNYVNDLQGYMNYGR